MKSHKLKCPRCKGQTQRLVSQFVPVTDTSFGYTGTVDRRVGPKPIEGRKDWHNRLEAKGLVPLTKADLDKQDTIEPVMEPLPDF